MSAIPGAREVLTHLNYLGYTNIKAHQLKEFMIDLKRFIKYEEQCEQHQPKYREEQEHLESEIPERDIFESLHHTDTVASRAKKKTKPPIKHADKHLITVEIHSAPKNTQTCTNLVPKLVIPLDSKESTSTDSPKCASCQCSQVMPIVPPNTISTVSFDPVSKSLPSTSKSLPELPLSELATARSTDKKKVRPKSARSSYIRPKIIDKPLKCDPVALYHQYKQEWDRIKFPGAYRHGETRWAVRAKLLGDR